MPKSAVLVTFDSMINPNSGYFSFGKGLGDAIIAQNDDRFSLKYYMFRKTVYQFGGRVGLIYLSAIDKLFFRHRNEFDVVHWTDQTCRLKPGMVNAKKIMTIH